MAAWLELPHAEVTYTNRICLFPNVESAEFLMSMVRTTMMKMKVMKSGSFKTTYTMAPLLLQYSHMR